MNLRSASAAAEAGNTEPIAGPSAGNTVPGPGNAEPSMVTISREDFEAMQAVMFQHSAAAPPSAVVPTSSAVSVSADSVPVAAPTIAPTPVVKTYRGKAPDVDRYSGGSRGLYNKFIRQCQTAFDIEENHTNAGQVAFGSGRLEGTPANVWDAYK